MRQQTQTPTTIPNELHSDPRPRILDPMADELRFWLVKATGEPEQIEPTYLRRNRRGERITNIRTVTHRSETLGDLTTALWITLSDGREILIQSTRFWSQLARHGSPALQAEADRLILAKMRQRLAAWDTLQSTYQGSR